MKIIDFEKKGNIVRFYLGEKTEDWGWTRADYKDWNGNTPDWLKPEYSYWGDDWDDRPYEHNAGRVSDRFIKGHKDIAFNFDDLVLEPCNGEWNSPWSKEDMLERRVPCIIVVPKELDPNYYFDDTFSKWVNHDKIIKYYFGDELEADKIY